MFSICLHSTNRAEYLENFLQSLTYQTDKDFEVVIVDNESKDDTEEVIRKFKRKLKINHIVFEYKDENLKNLNPIAYNLAVKNAKYDKIILTVGDVIFDINNVKNAKELFSKGVVIYGSSLEIEDMKLMTPIKQKKYKLDISKNKRLLSFGNNPKSKAWFKVNPKYPQPVFYCAVLSKEKYNAVGGMDEKFTYLLHSSDVDLGQRLQCITKTVYTDDIFVIHQKHDRPEIKAEEKELIEKGITLREQNRQAAFQGRWKVTNIEKDIRIIT